VVRKPTCASSSAASTRAFRVPAHGRPGRGRGRQDRDRRPRTSPTCPPRAMDLGIVVEVAGRKMQEDFEPVLERQIHYFVNGASAASSTSASATSPGSASARPRPTRASTWKHFGKILHARFHADFGAIVDKVQVKIYTDPDLHRRVAGQGPPGLRLPQQAPGRPDRRRGGRVLLLHAVPVLCAQPRLRGQPERLGLCGAYNWLDCKASFRSTPPAPTSRSSWASAIDGQGLLDKAPTTLCQDRLARQVEEVAMYSIMENPMTACGCFECIVMLIPEANGVMVVSREDPA
jgi:acetyl-CoA synthase